MGKSWEYRPQIEGVKDLQDVTFGMESSVRQYIPKRLEEFQKFWEHFLKQGGRQLQLEGLTEQNKNLVLEQLKLEVQFARDNELISEPLANNICPYFISYIDRSFIH